MRLEDYKAGKHIKVNNYKAFILSKTNYNWSWDDAKVHKLLAEASRQMGELNAYSLLIPNIDVYIKMFQRIEANKSNRIDGTNTIVEEDLQDTENIDPEKIRDWELVQNYFKCIEYSIQKVEEDGKLSTKIIKEMHKVLMQGVSKEQKNVGKLRTSQNWVGGDRPENAIYVPPPYEEVAECLVDFEEFIDNDDIDTPDLVKIAILHYQFESIHPFLDGNGRIGRMIVPLYLQSKGMLDKSCLYISNYLEKNKDKYFEMLMKVRDSSDIIGWIKFFLEVIIESAKDIKERLKNIVELAIEMDKVALEVPVKPENSRRVIEVLYKEPVIDIKRLCEIAEMKSGTTRSIINYLLEKEIVIKTKTFAKNKILIFQRYTDLLLK